MKIAMFKTQEQLNAWAIGMANACRDNGLKVAREQLAEAIRTGRDIEWHEGNVRYIERKIKKYERMVK